MFTQKWQRQPHSIVKQVLPGNTKAFSPSVTAAAPLTSFTYRVAKRLDSYKLVIAIARVQRHELHIAKLARSQHLHKREHIPTHFPAFFPRRRLKVSKQDHMLRQRISNGLDQPWLQAN